MNWLSHEAATEKVGIAAVGECDKPSNVLLGIGIVTEVVSSHLLEVMLKNTGDMRFRTTRNQKT